MHQIYFSTTGHEPSLECMATLPRLYVFTLSHYCEKARWACDRKGLRYRLVTLLPGAHLWTMRRFARATHVPLLIDGQRVIQDSSGIIDYLDEVLPESPLTPREPALAAQAREWEAVFDRELGQPLRRIFYYHALQDARFLAAEYQRGGPFWGSWFYALALPTIRRAVGEKYDVTAENVAQDLELVQALIQRLDQHFAVHRYLVGERFSRADLSLAALGAALVRPIEHPAHRYPSPLSLPGWLEQIAPFRGSATAERVRELYREERRVITLPPASGLFRAGRAPAGAAASALRRS